MARIFIRDNIKTNLFSSRDPIFPDGRFTVVNNSTINVNHDGRQFQSGLSLTADFQSAGRKKRMARTAVQTDYSGFNKKFITDAGVYDGVLALDEFAKVGADRGLVKPETYSVLTKFPQSDSHESFIYNMLISYLKARLSQGSMDDDERLIIKTSPYNDSHSVVALDQGMDDFTYEIDLGPPVTNDLFLQATFAIRSKDNYWSKPYVLYYNGTSTKAETFYLCHALGRNVSSDLNFDMNLKGVDTRQLLIDPINGRDYATIALDDIDWTDYESMWTWILDYVQVNRLEQAFAAAFELLGALAFQPMPPTLEACQWQESILTVTLADFSPTRARVRVNLLGEPYKIDALAEEFLVSETQSPTQFLGASAICNYYMWYGLYTILQNESMDMTCWTNVYTSVSGILQNLYSPVMRAMCISVATGKEYATCMNSNCAMYIDMSPLEDSRTIQGIRDLDGSVGNTVEINYIPAPVSGAIVLGTFTDAYDTTAHLASMYKLPSTNDPYMRFETDDILRIATVYRLFGYDTTIVDTISDETQTLWAANRECLPEPSKLLFERRRRRDWLIADITAREGRKEIIDSPQTLLSGIQSTVSIQQPTISYTAWRHRVKTLRPQALLGPRHKKKEIKFKVNAPVQMVETTLMARPISEKKKQGFISAPTQGPPVMPEETRVEEESVITAQAGAEGATDVNTA
nr:coat protein [Umbelopsis dimorpha virus 1b]